ncbi:MAG: acetate/propionate family kinase [Acetobacteraceae bacterium]
MEATILVVNAGSSSLKFAVWPDRGTHHAAILRGQISGIGRVPWFRVRNGDGDLLVDEAWVQSGDAAHGLVPALIDRIERQTGGTAIVAAGHRVVHGGTRFASPVVVDETVMRDLEDLVPLAPLHQPHNLAAIHALAATHPGLPQVACFDTAFHNGHADVADRFALPRALHDAGIRRYGFHGLSYEYVTRALVRLAPDLARGRVVIAHLGSGASLCAVHNGKSIDSTMGFTALDGLPMGTRSGALDAGVLLHLLELGQDHDSLERLLYHESGMLGVSGGISNDMRDLLASNQPEAAQAVDLFVYRVVREIASLAAAMGGVDGVVFTAGIGESSALIRDRVCRGCAWLGIELDAEANLRGDGRITTRGSRPSAWVIPTDEEQMIAQHTVEALGGVKEICYA